MAIIGLTHKENGELENKITKYRGKIATGWGPKEGPNKNNYPTQAGHFIAMTEVTKNVRVGDKVVPRTKWLENKDIQKLIEKSPGNDTKSPRILEITSLFKSPDDMWDTFLAMYNGDGLKCRGNGIGTEAKYLTFDDNGERAWKAKPCGFDKCPDYIAGNCKPNGVLKIYPTVDCTPPNPYKFSTNSMNTIRNLESALDDLWNLIKTAHAVKELEAGHPLPFDGMFGLKLYLVHKKTKSGGRDIFVTELVASKDFRDNIMKVINRAIEKKAEESALIGEAGAMSLLESAASVMIEDKAIEAELIETSVEDNEMDEAKSEALAAANAAMALMDED